MAYVFQEQDSQRFKKLLQDLLDRTESDDCLICDTGGFVMAQEGGNTKYHPQISALGAGVFAASRELARILGEAEFNTVFHQGTNKSIFICAVNAEILLVTIFSGTASIGLVKLYTAPAAAECRLIFEEIKARDDKERLPAEHQNLVLKDKSAIFGPASECPVIESPPRPAGGNLP